MLLSLKGDNMIEERQFGKIVRCGGSANHKLVGHTVQRIGNKLLAVGDSFDKVGETPINMDKCEVESITRTVLLQGK